MFYDSIDKWNDNDPNKYKFDLRFAVMKGLNKWEHCKKIVLETNKEIRAVTRPSFIQSPKGLVMVYSCDINGKYKLKAAIQNKHSGQKWIRDKSFSFNSSGQDWDSDEQSYCNIFNHEKDYYMLYNGNKYGKTGFGIAKLLSF
jgi:hypothetical protein